MEKGTIYTLNIGYRFEKLFKILKMNGKNLIRNFHKALFKNVANEISSLFNELRFLTKSNKQKGTLWLIGVITEEILCCLEVITHRNNGKLVF